MRPVCAILLFSVASAWYTYIADLATYYVPASVVGRQALGVSHLVLDRGDVASYSEEENNHYFTDHMLFDYNRAIRRP